MTTFAELDENDIVINVIVIEQEELNTGRWGNPNNFVQTSYNTDKGIHKKNGIPLRKNYAGKGMKYDRVRNMFVKPKPFPSWILNKDKGIYESPIPMPDISKNYIWNETSKTWDLI